MICEEICKREREKKQRMKKVEVDRGWDSWDSDRRRELVVAVMIYHEQMTARDTKTNTAGKRFGYQLSVESVGVCVYWRYACAWKRL